MDSNQTTSAYGAASLSDDQSSGHEYQPTHRYYPLGISNQTNQTITIGLQHSSIWSGQIDFFTIVSRWLGAAVRLLVVTPLFSLIPFHWAEYLLYALSIYLALLALLTFVPAAVRRDFSLHRSVALFAARLHLNLFIYGLAAIRLFFVLIYIALIFVYSSRRPLSGPARPPSAGSGQSESSTPATGVIWTRFGCSLLAFAIHAFGCCILYLGRIQNFVNQAENRLAN